MRKVKSLFLVGCAAMALVAVPVFAEDNGTVTGGSVALEPNSPVPMKVTTVDNGKGEWRYGTGVKVGLPPKKTAYSDMDHGSKTHKTSCEIDGNYDSSGWVKARTTSRSKTEGSIDSTAYCNWDVK